MCREVIAGAPAGVREGQCHAGSCKDEATAARAAARRLNPYPWRLWHKPAPARRVDKAMVGVMTEKKWQEWLRKGAREAVLAKYKHRDQYLINWQGKYVGCDEAARNHIETLPEVSSEANS